MTGNKKYSKSNDINVYLNGLMIEMARIKILVLYRLSCRFTLICLIHPHDNSTQLQYLEFEFKYLPAYY